MKLPVGYLAIALGLNLAAIGAAWADDALLDKARQYFAPLPKTMATAQQPLTPALVELGRALFFDPRMSVDGTASCARCHQPALYGISIDSRESFTMTRDVRCLR